MIMQFIGGPFDGMAIAQELLQMKCETHPSKKKGEKGLLVFMPPPLAWDRVMSGEVQNGHPFDTVYAYEQQSA